MRITFYLERYAIGSNREKDAIGSNRERRYLWLGVMYRVQERTARIIIMMGITMDMDTVITDMEKRKR